MGEQTSLCAVVQRTNGTQTEFMLSEVPQITYGKGVVNVTTSTTTLEFKSSEVKRVYMAQKSVQGIGTTKTAQNVARVDISSAAVTVTGLEPGSDAALYTADGRYLKAANVASDGTLSLPMPKSQGVFIVKTKNQSFKIINKQ